MVYQSSIRKPSGRTTETRDDDAGIRYSRNDPFGMKGGEGRVNKVRRGLHTG